MNILFILITTSYHGTGRCAMAVFDITVRDYRCRQFRSTDDIIQAEIKPKKGKEPLHKSRLQNEF
jgi:hypothetical protein